MVVSTVPYLHDPNDVAAVIKGIENLQAALSSVKGLTWVDPAPGITPTAYVNNVCPFLISNLIPSDRRQPIHIERN